MTALQKVLALSGSPAAPGTREEDPAGELVLAAASALGELRVLLAKADDDNDGDEADDNEQTASGKHAGHPTYKQMVKKGLKPAEAAAMCAKADKKVAASALCEAAIIALAGLDAAKGDWVQLTALDTWTLSLADSDSDVSTSQGPGENYADPGYREGKKRYPTTKGGKLSQERIRAAWSYINHEKNAGMYSSVQLSAIKGKIKAAAKKAGVDISDDGEKVSASVVELAAKQPPAMAAESHPPFHGVHSHSHVHNGDNLHGPGPDRMQPGGGW